VIVKICRAHQNIVIEREKNKTFLAQLILEHLPSAGIDGYFSSNALSLGRGFKLVDTMDNQQPHYDGSRMLENTDN
jgi:hypothetical protein